MNCHFEMDCQLNSLNFLFISSVFFLMFYFRMTFADAYLQLEVVACIKSVMSSKIGLDFVASNEESTRKLARGEVFVKDVIFSLRSE